jgi:transposase
VACINGTTSKKLIQTLSMLPRDKRDLVEEVTMDMAPSMEAAVSEVFTNAKRVTDRFHVAKLAIDAIQRVRIDLRWMELDKESAAIAQARRERKPYKAEELANYETPKQLLARLRTTLMKTKKAHSETQTLRRSIAFQRYPELERAYQHGMRLRDIFEETNREVAAQKLGEWIRNTFEHTHQAFYSVARTIEAHRENILNYFNRRATNASAESFNAKLKLFRANQRGVQDLDFFLFRLEKLFA